MALRKSINRMIKIYFIFGINICHIDQCNAETLTEKTIGWLCITKSKRTPKKGMVLSSQIYN
jgi:hypothetical protein